MQHRVSRFKEGGKPTEKKHHHLQLRVYIISVEDATGMQNTAAIAATDFKADIETTTVTNTSESTTNSGTDNTPRIFDEKNLLNQNNFLDSEPERTKRAYHKGDGKNKKIQKKEQELTEAVEKIEAELGDIDQISDTRLLLMVLLPIAHVFCPENGYRFIMGMLDRFRVLPQKELAVVGNCSPELIHTGRLEYMRGELPSLERARKKGGGRKKLSDKNPGFIPAILKAIRNTIFGECTENERVYTKSTLKSIRDIVVRDLNIDVSFTTIGNYLKALKIRKTVNQKLESCSKKFTKEQQKRCDDQFEFIKTTRKEDETLGTVPILSSDTKKKINVGPFASKGDAYTEKGKKIRVKDHDFFRPLVVKTLKGIEDLLTRQEGKAIPYSILDTIRKVGYTFLTISHDTPESVAAAFDYYLPIILKNYPDAPYVDILMDGGGGNGAKSWTFKYNMALVADRIGKPLKIIHYPPYKSKYNDVERDYFAPMSRTFWGHPLYCLREIMGLILATKADATGLKSHVVLNCEIFETGQKTTQEEIDAIDIEYIGPTKDDGVHLSYIIKGTKDKRGLLPQAPRMTVFELQENIHKSEEEKEAEKQAKKEAKAQKDAERAQKKAAAEEKRAQKEAAAKEKAAQKEEASKKSKKKEASEVV